MTILKSFAVMFGLIVGVAAAEAVSAQDAAIAPSAPGGFTNGDMKISGA